MRDRLGHVPALDGLRGVAVLLVVTAHAFPHGPFQGGVLGVDLFFVLSGYLITSLLLDEWRHGGAVSLSRFYGRRARRLLPALALLLVAFFLFEEARGHPWHGVGSAILGGGYLMNLVEAVGFTPDPHLTHLWSLAQEEQFYIIWPGLLVVLLARWRERTVAGIIAGLIVAICIERAVLAVTGSSATRLWIAPDTHGDAILFGCAAALLRPRLPRRAVLAAAVTAATVVATFRIHSVTLIPIGLPVFAAAAAVLVAGARGRFIEWKPLRATGRISYSLYLWHYPLIVLLGLPGVPIAFAATWASTRFVEEPIRRRRGRRSAGLEPAVSPSAAS